MSLGVPGYTVVFGSGGSAVTLSWEAMEGGLTVTLAPRAPAERVMGDGSVEAIYGPGAGLRVLSVSGVGGQVPSLGGLDLDADQAVVISWPDGSTTSLTVRVQPVQHGGADFLSGRVAWSIRALERAG